MKRLVRFAAAAAAMGVLMFGCGKKAAEEPKLDPKSPVNITIWHYYNGVQKTAFDSLVEEFNQTEGSEIGIYVQAHSQGSVTDLEKSVMASFEKKVGSEEAPDIFSTYADTAYAIEKMGRLVDLEDYLTAEELSAYVDTFVEEGRIGTNGELRIFPTAKSSEIFMMNKTAWDAFANATGASLRQITTLEGLAETAKDFYEWTDSLTPDVSHDGKAFYGRDAMANLFNIGSMQLGVELFGVEQGKVQLHVDEMVMRDIWNCYYVPYISGYFSSYGRFRSDDLKIGEVISYTGATSSAGFFPDKLETEDAVQEIDYIVLPVPMFRNGAPYAVQQGAGMAVIESTALREMASVHFLKWFTKEENNVRFCVTSGYMPVKTAALNKHNLDETIAKFDLDVSPKTKKALYVSFDMMEYTTLYTNKAFENGAAARSVLERHLHDRAVHDRERVKQRLAQGQTVEQAVADFAGDTAFTAWLADFQAALEKAVALT